MHIDGRNQTTRTSLQPLGEPLGQARGFETSHLSGKGGLLGGTSLNDCRALTPVQQGEIARLDGGIEEFIQKLVDSLTKFLEYILGTGNQGKPQTDAPAKATKPDGPSATTGTVEGAKTIDDFKLVGASKKDKADFKAMLAYLQRADANGKAVSPTAVELLAKLPDDQVVKINKQHQDYFDPSSSEIGWDPRSALIVNGTDEYQSPALGFIHEVDHAVNMIDPKPTGDDYHNTEEKRVITGTETQIAKDFGEPTRKDHLGDVKHVGSSTEHS